MDIHLDLNVDNATMIFVAVVFFGVVVIRNWPWKDRNK